MKSGPSRATRIARRRVLQAFGGLADVVRGVRHVTIEFSCRPLYSLGDRA